MMVAQEKSSRPSSSPMFDVHAIISRNVPLDCRTGGESDDPARLYLINPCACKVISDPLLGRDEHSDSTNPATFGLIAWGLLLRGQCLKGRLSLFTQRAIGCMHIIGRVHMC